MCPVRIDIPRMLVDLREHLDRGGIAPRRVRLVFRLARRLMEWPTLFRAAVRASGAPSEEIGGSWDERYERAERAIRALLAN